MPFLDIAFNLPLRSTLTYRCDEPVAVGCRVNTILGSRRAIGWVVGVSDEPPEHVTSIRDIGKVVDREPLFDREGLDLARWLSDLTMCSLGEALATMLPTGKRESLAGPDADDGSGDFPDCRLTASQQSAFETVSGTGGGSGNWFYLYGNTGSGKTEVFLRAAARELESDRGVIYLVPEIALSHHLVEGFRRRFPDQVAVIHSGLTPSRRLSEWRRIQSGEARFVLGARSAVFAPLKNPGLIIIDEEHEGSYKSSSTPRYHARQVAMRRCRVTGARLLMGSATPSIEAWHLMSTGLLVRVELTGRPAGGAMPAVRVADLKREQGLFSGVLMEAMSRVLAEGRQVLLFLNRRGFSYRFSCRSCGEEVHCRRCSVPMTYHKIPGVMKCHYCGYSTGLPVVCPSCGSTDMNAAGFGTERIEEDIRHLFPEKRVMRLDTDSVQRKGALAGALRDFRHGEIDILLGTQMVAKGLNAPGVKLAGVLNADSALNLPDFRSAERTFALIVQVAGRAGRFRPDGEVIVQTFRPESPSIRLAVENRISEFYNQELQQRRLLGFPPFSRLFRLVLRGVREEQVIVAAEHLAGAMRIAGDDWETLGPAECPIGRISDRYRYQVLLRTRHFDRTHGALAAVLDSLKLPSGIGIEIDIDPVNLL